MGLDYFIVTPLLIGLFFAIYFIARLNQEISPDRYKTLSDMLEKYPELKPIVPKNKKIDQSIFLTVLNKYDDLEVKNSMKKERQRLSSLLNETDQ